MKGEYGEIKPVAWMANSNSHASQFTADRLVGEHGWTAIGSCYVTRLYNESHIDQLSSLLECAKKDIELRDREIAALSENIYRLTKFVSENHTQIAWGRNCVDVAIELLSDLPKLKADAIRALEEKVHDGQIKVASGSHCLCDWVDAGEWLLSEADELEAGDDS